VFHIEERVEGNTDEGANCKVGSKSHRNGTVSLTTVVVVELRFAIGVVLGIRVAVVSIVICVGVVFCVVAYVSIVVSIRVILVVGISIFVGILVVTILAV